VAYFRADTDNLAKDDPKGVDLLSAAVRAKSLNLVKLLIVHGADPNRSDILSLPLTEAVGIQEDMGILIVEELLRQGADPNTFDLRAGCSPLEVAKRRGNKTMMKLLAKRQRK
jgi:ankyrin repeat protein